MYLSIFLFFHFMICQYSYMFNRIKIMETEKCINWKSTWTIFSQTKDYIVLLWNTVSLMGTSILMIFYKRFKFWRNQHFCWKNIVDIFKSLYSLMTQQPPENIHWKDSYQEGWFYKCIFFYFSFYWFHREIIIFT